MLRLKTFSVIIHIAGWLLFMALPLLFLNSRDGSTSIFVLLTSPFYWLFSITYITLFYLNALVLIPRFFLTRQYLNYALVLVILFALVFNVKPYDKLLRSRMEVFKVGMQGSNMPPDMGPMTPGQRDGGTMPPPPPPSINNKVQQSSPGNTPPNNIPWPNGMPPGPGMMPPNGRKHLDINSLFIFLMIMALSTATKTVQQWQVTEQRVLSAEADKASAELSFLKAQINPHFLFNTLNNIYTLAVTNNTNTAESIMKLSNIMRYVTDDVSANFVSLQAEIDCIENYIDLQRLRLGDKTTVTYTVNGDTGNKKIAPLLFMTFVENVFKYGVSKQHDGDIDINILVEDTHVLFTCVNPVFDRKENIERTGIGIANTRKRLEHLYPGEHVLYIDNDGKQFSVLLKLPC
ncbi:hypothetical protein FPZ43_05430 [Mucilaginibacter pallidiroseus]|uniref:Signal transduction histidine kinase internal region domain-containing protein n=1 Tax=Mucilaginibacter pallidiroseus TaxID=2599295 RepID=A0A563UGA3_9SPHI|nr:sensor histidine kinase [Mucilaginibacter pallidiroseus]TWR30384.1 hypothetical protein FPZ43_05430 [Mucilaginibacter pallidiroseus]